MRMPQVMGNQDARDQLGTSWNVGGYIMGYNGTFMLILLNKINRRVFLAKRGT